VTAAARSGRSVRGYAQSQAARQISRAIMANNEATSAMLDKQYRARSAGQDRIHDNFTHYVRGTERVHDPVRGATSEPPSAYRCRWTDALGTVQHSGDPNYNPNIGSTTTWSGWSRCPDGVQVPTMPPSLRRIAIVAERGRPPASPSGHELIAFGRLGSLRPGCG
jgi:hypothetical protein